MYSNFYSLPYPAKSIVFHSQLLLLLLLISSGDQLDEIHYLSYSPVSSFSYKVVPIELKIGEKSRAWLSFIHHIVYLGRIFL